jgi:hypothetical protein
MPTEIFAVDVTLIVVVPAAASDVRVVPQLFVVGLSLKRHPPQPKLVNAAEDGCMQTIPQNSFWQGTNVPGAAPDGGNPVVVPHRLVA